MRRIIMIAIVCAALFLTAGAGICRAGTTLLKASHSYLMGDSETKADAREKCYLEAKRKILEQAGTYSEVMSMTENFILSRDEVQTVSAGFARVRVAEEKYRLVREKNMEITLSVEAEVDLEEVKARLQEIGARRAEAERIRRREAKQAKAAAGKGAVAAVYETGSIDPAQVASLTRKGMHRDEVLRRLGRPDAEKVNSLGGFEYVGLAYGPYWVVLKDDITACVRKRLEFNPRLNGYIHCSGFADNFILR